MIYFLHFVALTIFFEMEKDDNQRLVNSPYVTNLLFYNHPIFHNHQQASNHLTTQKDEGKTTVSSLMDERQYKA